MELVNAESLRRGFTTLQMEKSLKNEGDRQNSTNHIEIMLWYSQKPNPYITNKFIRDSFFTNFGDSISSASFILYGKANEVH